MPIAITPDSDTMVEWSVGLDPDGGNLQEVGEVLNRLVLIPYVNSLPGDWTGVILADRVGAPECEGFVEALYSRSALKPQTDPIPLRSIINCKNAPCNKNEDCGGNAPVCNKGGNVCTAPRANGEGCTYDDSCASGHCTSSLWNMFWGQCA